MIKKYQQKLSGKTISAEKLKANTQGKGIVKALAIVLVLLILICLSAFYVYNNYIASYHKKATQYYDKAVEYKEGFEETVDKIDQTIEDVQRTKQEVESKWEGFKGFVDKFTE